MKKRYAVCFLALGLLLNILAGNATPGLSEPQDAAVLFGVA